VNERRGDRKPRSPSSRPSSSPPAGAWRMSGHHHRSPRAPAPVRPQTPPAARIRPPSRARSRARSHRRPRTRPRRRIPPRPRSRVRPPSPRPPRRRIRARAPTPARRTPRPPPNHPRTHHRVIPCHRSSSRHLPPARAANRSRAWSATHGARPLPIPRTLDHPGADRGDASTLRNLPDPTRVGARCPAVEPRHNHDRRRRVPGPGGPVRHLPARRDRGPAESPRLARRQGATPRVSPVHRGRLSGLGEHVGGSAV
jgi:hypothetical protein